MHHEPIHVLIVDTDETSLKSLEACLGKCGFLAGRASGAEEALQAASKSHPDLVLINLAMAGADSLQICRQLKSDPGTRRIPIAGITMPDNHMINSRAMEAGVSIFLTKPICEPMLKAHFAHLLRIEQLRGELDTLKDRLDSMGEYHRRISPGRKPGSKGIISESTAMQEVIEKIRMSKDLDTAVFIVGEHSTGKHLVAEALHWDGRRASWPFVHVDCSVVEGDIVESELFGYSRGTSRAGDHSARGLVEVAQGGTLFVSGLNDAPPAAMSGLLGIIDTGRFCRRGETTHRNADVRIILSANFGDEDNEELRRFYHSLLRRADLITIELPPLREREEDIALLARYFLSHCTLEEGLDRYFSEEALQAIEEYHWPGNIGELRRVVERAAVHAGTKESITLRCLPPEVANASKSSAAFPPKDGPPRSLRPKRLLEIEEDYIKEILKREKGNRTKAARALGISRSTIKRKIAGNPALQKY